MADKGDLEGLPSTSYEQQENEPNSLFKARKSIKSQGRKKVSPKQGVVYMSRVPPHMKPQKVRHLLEQYGEIGRLYLAPEDPGLRKRRKKLKGNTGKNFSEGWIEFEDKRVAKQVASMLNGNQMGGKRRSAYHYDIWCLKYLPKFKWEHLTEEIAYQNAVREQKLAAEISAAKRERDFYMSRVDQAKAADARQERQKRKAEEQESAAAEGEAEVNGAKDQPKAFKKILRTYGQKKAQLDSALDDAAPMLSQDVLSLLAGRKGHS